MFRSFQDAKHPAWFESEHYKFKLLPPFFNPGPIDGLMGPRTSAALREFQQKEDLKETGRLDAETRAHLMASSGAPAASPASGPTAPSVKPQTR